jgi:hypothetical protein
MSDNIYERFAKALKMDKEATCGRISKARELLEKAGSVKPPKIGDYGGKTNTGNLAALTANIRDTARAYGLKDHHLTVYEDGKAGRWENFTDLNPTIDMSSRRHQLEYGRVANLSSGSPRFIPQEETRTFRRAHEGVFGKGHDSIDMKRDAPYIHEHEVAALKKHGLIEQSGHKAETDQLDRTKTRHETYYRLTPKADTFIKKHQHEWGD